MPILTQKSQEERPVYCRNCYIPMQDLQPKNRDGWYWRCEKCGLEWKPLPTTKSAMADEVRTIVSLYQDGESLKGTHLQFVLRLLDNHPNAKQKIGSGVKSIIVKTNPVYRNTRGFFLHRHDGTSTDFSWVKCITPSNHRTHVLQTFRTLIDPQILTFKQHFFDWHKDSAICEINKTPIQFIGSHVDHVAPLTFKKLFSQFLESENKSVDDIELTQSTDNTYQRELTDHLLAARWKKFHQKYARLRVISAAANLALGKDDQ